MPGRAARKSYHHGDARNALLIAGRELLERAGAAEFSLRAVAERAGLSHQAPYNHFADKQALLAELAGAGFTHLEAQLRASRGYPRSGSLAHAALAYIEFAQRNPALFRLMFSQELVDLARFPLAKAAAERAYASLARIIASFASLRYAADLSLAAWCLVHGYATLTIEAGIEGSQQRTRRAQLFARIIRRGVADTSAAVRP
jgi:AcrR family transcriptional regulator